jgi:hypothetical protein
MLGFVISLKFFVCSDFNHHNFIKENKKNKRSKLLVLKIKITSLPHHASTLSINNHHVYINEFNINQSKTKKNVTFISFFNT